MAQIDWSKFSHKIYLNASIQKVYDSWTTRAGLESWFLRKAEFTMLNGAIREDISPVQKGDTYSWLWHGHPDTTTERDVVTEANGSDRFQFIFGKAGVVTVSLRQIEDNVTEMILTQDQIPTDEAGKYNFHVGCSTGWSFYEGNIKSVLEGGLDLRNKNPAYTNVINS